MENKVQNIAELLLSAVKELFPGDYRNVQDIKEVWHNVQFAFFSFVNMQRLLGDSADLGEMVSLGLVPDYLYEFINDAGSGVKDHIHNAVTTFFADKGTANDCRQELLNYELDFTKEDLTFFTDKVSRDNTGSYYTPCELAEETVRIALADKLFENEKDYRIADFSCGGGDFFLAIMGYLKERYDIDTRTSVKWFYGVDIDPIALQICIVNLLQSAEPCDWKTVISHFTFGNPLVICNEDSSLAEKNRQFAIGRLYSFALGLPEMFFDASYDVIVGNPPWEKLRFEERKFFRGIDNEIASLSQKHERDQQVKKLKATWLQVYDLRNAVYDDYARLTATSYKHCRIKLAVSGELNTYALFSELAFNMLSDHGLLALIVKSTLVTAPVHQKLWSSFLMNQYVKSIYLFENKNKIFNIDSRERFAVFVATKDPCMPFTFSAGLTEIKQLHSADSITMTAEDIAIINPFTNTIPNVSNNDEVAFLKNAHRQFSLFSEIYPKCHFGRLVHLTAHAAFIDKEPSEENLPIYEGKFLEQYDARYTTFRGLPETKKYANKAASVKTAVLSNGKKELPESRFFVHKDLWESYLRQYDKAYSLCWRSLTSPTNRRTMLAMILPTCPTCQSIQMLQTESEEELVLMLALFNSIPFDYFVRIKMPGLDLTQSVIRQIPVPSDENYSEVIEISGRKESLKKHILSYAISIIKEEDLLSGLIDNLKARTYEVEGATIQEKKKMIDHLFQIAYHLDDHSYSRILLTFPKYQADQTV